MDEIKKEKRESDIFTDVFFLSLHLFMISCLFIQFLTLDNFLGLE